MNRFTSECCGDMDYSMCALYVCSVQRMVSSWGLWIIHFWFRLLDGQHVRMDIQGEITSVLFLCRIVGFCSFQEIDKQDKSV